MESIIKTCFKVALTLAVCLFLSFEAAAQTTAFTYQGKLTDAGVVPDAIIRAARKTRISETGRALATRPRTAIRFSE